MFKINISLFIQQQFQKLSIWFSGLTDEQAIAGLILFFIALAFVGVLFRKFTDTRIGAAVTLLVIIFFIAKVGS